MANKNQESSQSGSSSQRGGGEPDRATILIGEFRDELLTLYHKSQETFEKQLSFISAGALGLSLAFIKDIVPSLSTARYKGLLGWGWAFLILTLLLNCVSHLLSAKYANQAIKEINENDYEPDRIAKRNKKIIDINWFTMATMIVGITLIILFITINTLL
jgi:membrane protein insertase Oxa1/YidC/SpoIIIJ